MMSMEKLSRNDLYSLEEYAQARTAFREKVLKHKRLRQVGIGEHMTLYFEDRLTMQYQIQEMLRIERIFEADAIEEELDTYNALIPDGDNLKATMMLEYTDVAARREALTQLLGIEDQTWLAVEGCDKVYAIADEDLERADENKTSAVHFVRFQLDGKMIEKLRQGARLHAGCDHENYRARTELAAESRDALAADLS